MRTVLWLAASIAALLLLMFGVGILLGLEDVWNVEEWAARGPAEWAVMSTGMLVVDVFLPVPSSLVMVANGTAFGWLGGGLLSTCGIVAATLVGMMLGKSGSPLAERALDPTRRERAERLISKYGLFAIALSRPIPVIAETVAILCGLGGVPLWKGATAGLLGAVPLGIALGVVGAAL